MQLSRAELCWFWTSASAWTQLTYTVNLNLLLCFFQTLCFWKGDYPLFFWINCCRSVNLRFLLSRRFRRDGAWLCVYVLVSLCSLQWLATDANPGGGHLVKSHWSASLAILCPPPSDFPTLRRARATASLSICKNRLTSIICYMNITYIISAQSFKASWH